jgi:hypothetical protein
MPRALAGAGRPLRPEELPDWLFHIGRRPLGERRAVTVWLAAEAPHLMQPNGRPVKAFHEERRRRRWQELDGYGTGFLTRLYRDGDVPEVGDDAVDRPAHGIDPRRLMAAPAAPSAKTSLEIARDEEQAHRDARIRQQAERQAATELTRRPVRQRPDNTPGRPIRVNRGEDPR